MLFVVMQLLFFSNPALLQPLYAFNLSREGRVGPSDAARARGDKLSLVSVCVLVA